jgi:hypothetical protein
MGVFAIQWGRLTRDVGRVGVKIGKVGGFDYWLCPIETLWEHLPPFFAFLVIW